MTQTDLNTSQYWDVCNWWLIEPRSSWKDPQLIAFALFTTFTSLHWLMCWIMWLMLLNLQTSADDQKMKCQLSENNESSSLFSFGRNVWPYNFDAECTDIWNIPLCSISLCLYFVQHNFISHSLFHLKHCHWRHYDLRVASVSVPFMVSGSCVVLPLPSFFSHSARLCQTMSYMQGYTLSRQGLRAYKADGPWLKQVWSCSRINWSCWVWPRLLLLWCEFMFRQHVCWTCRR